MLRLFYFYDDKWRDKVICLTKIPMHVVANVTNKNLIPVKIQNQLNEAVKPKTGNENKQPKIPKKKI